MVHLCGLVGLAACDASLLLGIDVGTYSSKGVLATPEGAVVARHVVEHGMDVPRPGWAEQDADAVWWHDVRRPSAGGFLAQGGSRPTTWLASG